MSGIRPNPGSKETQEGSKNLLLSAGRRSWLLLGMMFVVACSGEGGGCGDGCDNTPYPAQAPAVENAVQVRVTEHGFGFLEEQVEPLLGQFLGGEGLTFCIPPQEGPDVCYARTCPSTGEAGCEISVELADVQINPVEPSEIQVQVAIDGLDPETDFVEVDLGSIAECIVRLDSDGGIPATVKATFETDPRTGDVSLDLNPNDIEIGFDQLVVDLDGADFIDTFACEGLDFLANLSFLRDILFGLFTQPLTDAINTATSPLLCLSCEGNEDCPSGTTCQVNEFDEEGGMICYNAEQERCAPASLGVEGVFDVGAALESVTPGLDADLFFQAKAHGYAQAVDDGFSIALKGGAYADKADCVPLVAPPATLEAPVSPTFQENITPDGDPYQLGLGVSRHFLDEALWGVYNSGALCLSVGTETSDVLSTGTFGTLLPSLRTLTNGNAPFYLQFAPKEPPTMKIGQGTVDPESGEIIDPLLTLDWRNLEIEFYAFLTDRFVRVMTVKADLVLPLSLDVQEEGIVIVLGDLTESFNNVEILHNELLTEDTEFLQGLLPSLINVALPLLGDSLADPIEIPEFAGFVLELNNDSIQGIDNGDMLAIFANLGLAPPVQEASQHRVDTGLELLELTLPPSYLARPVDHMTETERVQNLMEARPVALVRASASLWGEALEDSTLEFSYRVDGGPWSTFRRDPLLVVDNPVFLLQGVHTVEVRARFQDNLRSVDRSPASIEIDIDFDHPDLSLSLEDTVLTIHGVDAGHKPEDLTYSLRVNGGEWSAWSAQTEVDLGDLAKAKKIHVEVKARDRAGFEASTQRTFQMAHAEPVVGVPAAEPVSQEGGGCTQTPGQGNRGGALALFATMVMGLLFWRRRGGQVAVALGALAALVGLSGCDEEDKKNNFGQTVLCPEECAAGQECVDGACVVPCLVDADCGSNEACEDNVCKAGEGCTTDADCPGREVCYEEDGNMVCGNIACNEDSQCAGLSCATSGICDGGSCACAPPCAEGCGDGQYCCDSANACEELPNPCDGFACDPGFRGEVSAPAFGNSATCEVTPGTCECVELDPLAEGVIGRYSDVAVFGEQVIVSAYNETYGDLMVGIWKENGEIAWTFVDGLPENGSVTGRLTGPRGGVSTPGPDVGRYNSIDVDTEGNLHIAYRDDENKRLKYALGTLENGQYTFETHPLDEEGDNGFWPDISVGAANMPGVAYMTLSVIEDGNKLSKVRWAQAGSSTPVGEGWVKTDLDVRPTTLFCSGSCPTGQKCRADTNTCERTQGSARCDNACAETEACFVSGCAPLGENPGIQELPLGRGLFASVARFADSSPAVVYYDSYDGDLRYVRREGANWSTPVILDGRNEQGEDTGDMGRFASMAIDANDNVHVTYMDMAHADLRYINLGEGTMSVVDDGVRITPDNVLINRVGPDTAILVDAEGQVRILYQDATQHHLLLARQDDGGNWSYLTVAGAEEPYTGSFGFSNAQVWRGGESVITTFRYNRQTDPAESGVSIFTF